MHFRFLVSLLFCSLVFLPACDKEEELSDRDILVQNNWLVEGIYCDGQAFFGRNCGGDDLLDFREDGTFSITVGVEPDTCTSNIDPASGTYIFQGDSLTLRQAGIPDETAEVLRLDETALHLGVQEATDTTCLLEFRFIAQ